MKFLKATVASLLIALAIVIGANPRNVYSQAQAVLFGSYMGAAKAVTVTTNGYLNVAVNGGGSGVVPCLNGGTGLSAYTIGDLIYASASCALSKLADVATGSVLVSGGVGVAPSWSAAPTFGTGLITGPVQISGGSFLTNKNIYMTGTLNHSTPAAMYIDTALTGINNAGSGGQFISLQGSFSLAGNSASVYNLDLGAPIVTLNGFTVTNAANIHISNTPTQGTNKRSIWVETGLAQFDSGITLPSLFLGAAGAGNAGSLAISVTAPTRSSGFGTNADASFAVGSTSFAFDMNIGTGGAPTTGVLSLPTAAHGWACQVTDITTVADVTSQSAYTTNTATLTSTIAWSAGDHLVGGCKAF